MINSMTGYGNSSGQFDGATYIVEIRSVNNRYFKARVKLPEPLFFLEEEITEILHNELSRGVIDFVLHVKNIPADFLVDIDRKALASYLVKLSEAASSVDLKCSIDIGGLLALPEVTTPAVPDEGRANRMRQTIFELTKKALVALKQMRAAEGKALVEDLLRHCSLIREKLQLINKRSDVVLKEYAKRLAKRADELLAASNLQIDKETVAREVAVFAERSDISEEIARLDSHINQFTDTCSGKAKEGAEQAGRRLDFISQEMLREANTIASKAADAEIIHIIVDIKCLIDRIKEQVQNVE